MLKYFVILRAITKNKTNKKNTPKQKTIQRDIVKETRDKLKWNIKKCSSTPKESMEGEVKTTTRKQTQK